MPFHRVDVDRDAAPVVDDLHAAVLEDRHHDPVAVAGQRFVDGVVDDLPHEVVQTALTGRADVHARALADRLEPFEDLDRRGVVRRCGERTGRRRGRVGPDAGLPSARRFVSSATDRPLLDVCLRVRLGVRTAKVVLLRPLTGNDLPPILPPHGPRNGLSEAAVGLSLGKTRASRPPKGRHRPGRGEPWVPVPGKTGSGALRPAHAALSVRAHARARWWCLSRRCRAVPGRRGSTAGRASRSARWVRARR